MPPSSSSSFSSSFVAFSGSFFGRLISSMHFSHFTTRFTTGFIHLCRKSRRCWKVCRKSRREIGLRRESSPEKLSAPENWTSPEKLSAQITICGIARCGYLDTQNVVILIRKRWLSVLIRCGYLGIFLFKKLTWDQVLNHPSTTR